MNKELTEAITQLEKDKGMSQDMLYEAIEAAIAKAYRRHITNGHGRKESEDDYNIEVTIDRENGDFSIVAIMDIVSDEEMETHSRRMTLSEAQEIDPSFEIGEQLGIEQEVPTEFSRIAATNARQFLTQKIREAENDMIYNTYIGRVGEVMTGTVQSVNDTSIHVNLGRTEGTLPIKEQVPGENFKPHDRIKVYVMAVKKPEPVVGKGRGGKRQKNLLVLLSRTHPDLVKCLFEQEVPEIEEGIVEIKGMAREAGSRTKMTVWSDDPNVDPVGACVGARGARVQAVVDELFNEKIDIINWSPDPVELVTNVLSPAKVEQVFLEEEEKIASVVVPDYQLSLAIGKSGQNVRLAAKLCGWKIDIKSHTQYYGEEAPLEDQVEEADLDQVEEEADA